MYTFEVKYIQMRIWKSWIFSGAFQWIRANSCRTSNGRENVYKLNDFHMCFRRPIGISTVTISTNREPVQTEPLCIPSSWYKGVRRIALQIWLLLSSIVAIIVAIINCCHHCCHHQLLPSLLPSSIVAIIVAIINCCYHQLLPSLLPLSIVAIIVTIIGYSIQEALATVKWSRLLIDNLQFYDSAVVKVQFLFNVWPQHKSAYHIISDYKQSYISVIKIPNTMN